MIGSRIIVTLPMASVFLVVFALILPVLPLRNEACGLIECDENSKCCDPQTSTCCLRMFNCCKTSCCNPYTQICSLGSICLQLNEILPHSGPLSGSTVVNVTGLGFEKEIMECRFGSVTTNGTMSSGQQAVCAAPQSVTPGIVSFAIANSGDETFSLPLNFTYYIQPTISSLYPPLGPTEGCTTVNISGKGFLPGISGGEKAMVMFGETTVPGKVLNDTLLTVTSTPPLSLATRIATAHKHEASTKVRLAVALNGADFEEYSEGFEYYHSVISHLEPSRILQSKLPANISIHGNGFVEPPPGFVIAVTFTMARQDGTEFVVEGYFESNSKVVALFGCQDGAAAGIGCNPFQFNAPAEFRVSMSFNGGLNHTTSPQNLLVDTECGDTMMQSCERCILNDSCGWCLGSMHRCIEIVGNDVCDGGFYLSGCPATKAEITGVITNSIVIVFGFGVYFAGLTLLSVIALNALRKRNHLLKEANRNE